MKNKIKLPTFALLIAFILGFAAVFYFIVVIKLITFMVIH